MSQVHRMLAGILLAMSTAASAGTASVQFTHTDTYADFNAPSYGPAALARELAQRFEQRARALPDNMELRVDVLGFDLAGKMVPSSGVVNLVREVTEQDWPSMRLRYTLLRDGQVVASGEDSYADMGAVSALDLRRARNDQLHFEKHMIDSWYHSRIASR